MNNRTKTAPAAALLLLGLHLRADAQVLGSADRYAVLAGSTVVNAGATTVTGDLGIWPGATAAGFPPGVVVNGSTHLGDAAAHQAQTDLATAYDAVAGEAPSGNLTGQDLGGMTLTPGIYFFSSSAFLTGTLTLDGLGDPNARFDFQIGSTLITAGNAHVNVIDGGACNVFWQVGSSATLGTGTAFAGHILAFSSITLNSGASIVHGGALARNGAVMLDTNSVAVCPQAVPEPSSLLAAGGLGLCALTRRRPTILRTRRR